MAHPIHCALCGTPLTDDQGVVLINTRIQLHIGVGDVWTCDAHTGELESFAGMWEQFVMSPKPNETVH